MSSARFLKSVTGWRKTIGCLKLKVSFRKRATNHRALLRKMTSCSHTQDWIRTAFTQHSPLLRLQWRYHYFRGKFYRTFLAGTPYFRGLLCARKRHSHSDHRLYSYTGGAHYFRGKFYRKAPPLWLSTHLEMWHDSCRHTLECECELCMTRADTLWNFDSYRPTFKFWLVPTHFTFLTRTDTLWYFDSCRRTGCDDSHESFA